ncbi:MAG: T9SS type A sorting domain-containing protein [Bacteroidota bacterium]
MILARVSISNPVSVAFLLLVTLSMVAVAADGGLTGENTSSAATEYHYEPLPGKLVGVWPDAWTVDRLTELRTRYGFTGVLVKSSADQYRAAIEAGFLPENIMIQLVDSYVPEVDNLDAGFYFIDEPSEHDCSGNPSGLRLYSVAELWNRLTYIQEHRPESKFVLSGYKRCSHNKIASAHAHVMMYASYHNWNSAWLPTCAANMGYGADLEAGWIRGDGDQRDSWSDARNAWGVKFSMTWIDGRGDEYDVLMGHARNLGLNGVWMYNYGAIDPGRLGEFSYAASRHGWLTLVEGAPPSVVFGGFQAEVIDGPRVRLEWETLSETRSYGFTIQRRHQKEKEFEDLPGGFVPGSGTTVRSQKYAFIDSTVSRSRWWYRLKMADLDGKVVYSETRFVNTFRAAEATESRGEFGFLQNYPNPFNPTTNIQFELPHRSRVRLSVYNVLGESIVTLVDSELPGGRHSVQFDGSDLAGGVYFYRIQVQPLEGERNGAFSVTRKLILTR